jgi:hypothetical protein
LVVGNRHALLGCQLRNVSGRCLMRFTPSTAQDTCVSYPGSAQCVGRSVSGHFLSFQSANLATCSRAG